MPYTALVEAVSATAGLLPCTLSHSGVKSAALCSSDTRASFAHLCVCVVAQLPVRVVVPILSRFPSTVAVYCRLMKSCDGSKSAG